MKRHGTVKTELDIDGPLLSVLTVKLHCLVHLQPAPP